jgi:Zn-dependent M28 family amino/carboxypeptidase
MKYLSFIGLLALRVCAADTDARLAPALQSISGEDMLRHIRVLSSDEFEGRAPASKGEELTVNYLIEQFKSMRLQPGNPDGSWTQDVPMVGVTSSSKLAFTQNGKRTELAFPQDIVGWAPRLETNVSVSDSEIVFIGYGVEAPEYKWDDFKGADLRGKTLLMLVNDPAIPDAANPKELDEKMFRGKAMTYYGRWTYKYEIAAAKGAVAAILIHETGPAGYPYFVVINSWGRENFMLKDSTEKTLQFASWMSLDRAKATLAAAGQNFDDLKKRAISRDFRPIPLGISFSASVTNKMREVRSKNVIAKLPGQHPQRKNEYVIYTAHWDHLGRDPRLEGDQIFNGAMDNASGVASMLEVAEAFTKLTPAPDRTILFLAVTAEEKGLLGSKYYAEHPLYPLRQTLANFNFDGASLFGRRRDLGIVGYGNSMLDDLIIDAAKTQGRTVRPEISSEKGTYYRSDHFEFAKVGVPAIYLDKIDGEYEGKPADYAQKKRDEYLDRDYHKPSDEIKPDWDMTGAVDDTQIFFLAGERVAREDKWPEWKPGTEFKARRDAMLH